MKNCIVDSCLFLCNLPAKQSVNHWPRESIEPEVTYSTLHASSEVIQDSLGCGFRIQSQHWIPQSLRVEL